MILSNLSNHNLSKFKFENKFAFTAVVNLSSITFRQHKCNYQTYDEIVQLPLKGINR